MLNELDRGRIGSERRPLRLLLVEDNPDDADLCLRALKKATVQIVAEVVGSRQQFVDRLNAGNYDVILTDYFLGPWNGMDVLTILRESGRNTPLILVTGALGEERAVECIREGVADYILKDRLERLPVAIARALENMRLRDEREQAELSLRDSEVKFRTLAEGCPAATFVEQGTRCRYVNRAAEEITGYTREELLGMNFWELIHPESRKSLIEQMSNQPADEREVPNRHEIKIITKRHEIRWVDMTVGHFEHEGNLAALFTVFDIAKAKCVDEMAHHSLFADPVTGLANYTRLLETFNAEMTRSQRTKRPFSVLFFNLDGMKTLNTEHGRDVGDRALRRIAHVLLQCRALDTPGRIEEDKFAMILPETDSEGALVMGRRVATRLAEGAEEPALFCHFGVAVYPRNGNTIFSLLDYARKNTLTVKPFGIKVT